jgi:hypothetical protein
MNCNSIYSLAPEFNEIQDLTNDFIRHFRITCNPGQFSTIFDKLKHFVALWTKFWLDLEYFKQMVALLFRDLASPNLNGGRQSGWPRNRPW